MNLIDTHSHLFVEEFADDLPAVIERAKTAGVVKVLMPNIDASTVEPLLAACAAYPDYCYPMMGLHPTSVDADCMRVLSELKPLFSQHPFIAVGEVGLDFYWDTTYRLEQERVFDCQVQWALDYNLPLVIHCREAYESMYRILLPYITEPQLRGVFHSFTGSADEAGRLMEFPGFRFGVNGVVTFKKSHLPEVLPLITVNRLLLETDSPYLSPVPKRGRRNESAYVVHVLQKVSEVLALPLAVVAETTTRNAVELFGLH